MVVLHEDERRAVLRFLKYGRGERLIHLAVSFPVVRIEDGARESFLERLSALGRVQGLISRAECDRVSLADRAAAILADPPSVR